MAGSFFMIHDVGAQTIPDVYVTSPADGATINTPTMNVIAKALTGATTYTIEFSTSDDFSTGLITRVGSRVQNFTGMSYGTTYFARVKTDLSPTYGKTTTFNVIPAEQLTFVKTPADLTTGLSVNLSITSSTVTNATIYTIEISASEDFSGVGSWDAKPLIVVEHGKINADAQ